MGKPKAQQAQKIVQQTEQNSQQEEEEINYTDIMTLENINNINNADLVKLKDNGFPTVESIAIAAFKQVESAIKGFRQDKFEKIKDAIKKQQGGSSNFKTGNQVLEKRQGVKKISTGSALFDSMIDGGVESQQITEVYGEFRTGKTQLAHTLCVTAQLSKSNGGGSGKVMYIDTEGTFRPERISSIAERFGLDAEATLDNIYHARAYSVDHSFEILKEANKLIYVEGPFALLIVDSIMAQFRVDFQGRGELSERQQQLGLFMKKLMEIANIYNMAVFITNQVMADPSGQTQGDVKKPIGGCVLAHASTVRLYLKKGKEDQRIAQLIQHPKMKDHSMKFVIKEDGIYDSPVQ